MSVLLIIFVTLFFFYWNNYLNFIIFVVILASNPMVPRKQPSLDVFALGFGNLTEGDLDGLSPRVGLFVDLHS